MQIGRLRRISASMVETRPTMTKLFQSQLWARKRSASAMAGFSQKRRTWRCDSTPATCSPGSIQP